MLDSVNGYDMRNASSVYEQAKTLPLLCPILNWLYVIYSG